MKSIKSHNHNIKSYDKQNAASLILIKKIHSKR